MQAGRHLWIGLALVVGMIGLPSAAADPTERRSTTPGPDVEFFGVIEEGETDTSTEWEEHGFPYCFPTDVGLLAGKAWDFVLRVLEGAPSDVLTLTVTNGVHSSAFAEARDLSPVRTGEHPGRHLAPTAVVATTAVPGNLEAIQHDTGDACVRFTVTGTQVAEEARYVVEVDGPPRLLG